MKLQQNLGAAATAIVAAAAAALLVYAVGAFIAWDWSPGQWSAQARAVVAFFMAAFALLSGSATLLW